MQIKKSLKELYYSKIENDQDLEKAGLKDKIKAGLIAGSASLLGTPFSSQINQPEPTKQEIPAEQKVSVKQETPAKQPSKLLEPGEILKEYQDPRHIPTEEFYENKYGLPKRLITSIRVAGEMSDWDQASNLGTKTVYQFTPHTRKLYIKKYNVDPWKDTDSSIHATALHLKESMNWAKKKFKEKDEHKLGILAAQHFHGGPNTKLWGGVNEKYRHRINKGWKMLQSDPDIEHLDHIFKQPQTIAEKSMQHYVDETLYKSLQEVKKQDFQSIVDEILYKSLNEVIKKS